MPPRRQRVKPNETVAIGGTRVTNKTTNSIAVSKAGDGAIQVVDCCLEEQGK